MKNLFAKKLAISKRHLPVTSRKRFAAFNFVADIISLEILFDNDALFQVENSAGAELSITETIITAFRRSLVYHILHFNCNEAEQENENKIFPAFHHWHTVTVLWLTSPRGSREFTNSTVLCVRLDRRLVFFFFLSLHNFKSCTFFAP